jgi:hypothetical protein
VGGWMGGWVEVKAVLRIAYSNQKSNNDSDIFFGVFLLLGTSPVFHDIRSLKDLHELNHFKDQNFCFIFFIFILFLTEQSIKQGILLH